MFRTKHRTTLTLLATVLLFTLSLGCNSGGGGSGESTVTPSSCTQVPLPRNPPVPEIPDPTLTGDLAITTVVPGLGTVIFFHPSVNQMDPGVIDFIVAHEYAHVYLHVPFGLTPSIALENEADCYAVEALYEVGLIDSIEAAIEFQLLSGNPGDATHLSGIERAFLMQQCLEDVINGDSKYCFQ